MAQEDLCCTSPKLQDSWDQCLQHFRYKGLLLHWNSPVWCFWGQPLLSFLLMLPLFEETNLQPNLYYWLIKVEFLQTNPIWALGFDEHIFQHPQLFQDKVCASQISIPWLSWHEIFVEWSSLISWIIPESFVISVMYFFLIKSFTVCQFSST